MSIARLNLTHCTHEFAKQVIENLRAYLAESNSSAPVGVWVDINGPKVR
jgi:pyruvate kinase